MAIGILAAGVVLIFIRRVVGDALIDSLTTLPQNRDAGHAIWWVATERLGAANLTTVCIGLLLLVGTWFAGPGRRATTSRRNLTPYLRDPAVAYGSYAAVILVLLVWAPVPAASDPITASILIVLGAIGVEALRRLVIREFPDVTERDLGHRLHTWASSLGQTARRRCRPTARRRAGGSLRRPRAAGRTSQRGRPHRRRIRPRKNGAARRIVTRWAR